MAQLQATTVNGTLNALRQENVTTASKTLAIDDRDKVVACTNSSAITITVPADGGTNFPIGSVIYIARIGTGAVTLAAAAGVTLTTTGNLGENEEIYIRKRSANNWVVIERPYSLTGSGGTTTTQGNLTSHSFTSNGTFTVSE